MNSSPGADVLQISESVLPGADSTQKPDHDDPGIELIKQPLGRLDVERARVGCPNRGEIVR